jgi:hypothetical protein
MRARRPPFRVVVSPIFLACVVLLAGAGLMPQAALANPRAVAVYQFQSTVPSVPGDMARDMFIAGLMKSGKFTLATNNLSEAEFIFDGILIESKPGSAPLSGGWVEILKGILSSEPGAFNVVVRVFNPQTGRLVDFVSVSSRELQSGKMDLARITSIIASLRAAWDGNLTPSTAQARQELLEQKVVPCIVEAIYRIEKKYGPSEADSSPLTLNQAMTAPLTAPPAAADLPAASLARPVPPTPQAAEPPPPLTTLSLDSLRAKFDPAQHEVADVQPIASKPLFDGANLIHTAPSGHQLFAVVRGGQVAGWTATDGRGTEIPLTPMTSAPHCWQCAMTPGLCWRVMCPLEGVTTR